MVSMKLSEANPNSQISISMGMVLADFFSMECPDDGGNGRWARSMSGLMNGIDYIDMWNGTAGNLIKLGRLAKHTLEGPRNNGTL